VATAAASAQTDKLVLTCAVAQTEPPAAAASVGAQTDPVPVVPARSVEEDAAREQVVRELREALLNSQQGKFEIELRLEEALLEAEKQRLQSIMELGKMRRALDSDKDSMDLLARDLEATFETLALTLVELSLEREQ